jgi:bifunctional DNA-binding transcriptional regulator/antitoxin component of YhaV-PrlF toxin-antitoxin module
MLAKKTSKNQITLPKPVAEAFPDAEYFDVRVENNKILLRPVRITAMESILDGVREKMKKLGVKPKDVAGAIRWARRKKK